MKNFTLSVLTASCLMISAVGCSTSNTTPPAVTVTPVLANLLTTTTIGSTIDPINGDANPYGLAIAPTTAGLITAGDLVVCNFNDSQGVAGNGSTIIDLKPTPGAMPTRIAQDASLTGCAALSITPGSGSIWAAAYTANDNPVFQPSGKLVSTLASSFAWKQPWGQIFASPTEPTGATAPQAYYIADAGDGSIIQANLTTSGITYKKIISGFPSAVNPTYGILAPAGLTYNPANDTLYVVSTDTNSVLAFTAVSTIPANGVSITYTQASMTTGTYGTTNPASFSFSGPAAVQAQVVVTGAPLNFPISSALLYNGNLIVGNTGDNNMLEVNPSTKSVVAKKLVDPGNPGAIFGIAATGISEATQKIFFNNDNSNSVIELSQ